MQNDKKILGMNLLLCAFVMSMLLAASSGIAQDPPGGCENPFRVGSKSKEE